MTRTYYATVAASDRHAGTYALTHRNALRAAQSLGRANDTVTIYADAALTRPLYDLFRRRIPTHSDRTNTKTDSKNPHTVGVCWLFRLY